MKRGKAITSSLAQLTFGSADLRAEFWLGPPSRQTTVFNWIDLHNIILYFSYLNLDISHLTSPVPYLLSRLKLGEKKIIIRDREPCWRFERKPGLDLPSIHDRLEVPSELVRHMARR
jgi:hypothetical protein